MSDMKLYKWAQELFDVIKQVVDVDEFALSMSDTSISKEDTDKLVDLLQSNGHKKVESPNVLGDFEVEHKDDSTKGLWFSSEFLEDEGVYTFGFFDENFNH